MLSTAFIEHTTGSIIMRKRVCEIVPSPPLFFVPFATAQQHHRIIDDPWIKYSNICPVGVYVFSFKLFLSLFVGFLVSRCEKNRRGLSNDLFVCLWQFPIKFTICTNYGEVRFSICTSLTRDNMWKYSYVFDRLTTLSRILWVQFRHLSRLLRIVYRIYMIEFCLSK